MECSEIIKIKIGAELSIHANALPNPPFQAPMAENKREWEREKGRKRERVKRACTPAIGHEQKTKVSINNLIIKNF